MKFFKQRSYLCAAITVMLALTACTNKARPPAQLVAEPDPTTLRLAEAADRVASAMEKLAAIKNKRTPTELPPLAANAPRELRRSMTIQWMGPVEPIVKRIAERASYEFLQSGSGPAIPIVININTKNQPLIEILRDIGLQISERGTLRVDAQEKVIELNYAQNKL